MSEEAGTVRHCGHPIGDYTKPCAVCEAGPGSERTKWVARARYWLTYWQDEATNHDRRDMQEVIDALGVIRAASDTQEPPGGTFAQTSRMVPNRERDTQEAGDGGTAKPSEGGDHKPREDDLPSPALSTEDRSPFADEFNEDGSMRCDLCGRDPCRCGVPKHFADAYDRLCKENERLREVHQLEDEMYREINRLEEAALVSDALEAERDRLLAGVNEALELCEACVSEGLRGADFGRIRNVLRTALSEPHGGENG